MGKRKTSKDKSGDGALNGQHVNGATNGISLQAGDRVATGDSDEVLVVAIDDAASVDELELSVRASNMLAKAEIHTVAELCGWTRAELSLFNGSSDAIVSHLEEKLAKVGRKLAAPGPSNGTPAAPPAAPKKTRNLRCRLTTKEHRAVARELARTHEELDDLDARIDALAEQKKDLQKERDVLEQRASEKARAYRARSTFRDVECVEQEGVELAPVNPDKPRVGIRTIRLDTDEAIEWREFKSSERQGDLFDQVTAP